MFQKTKFKDAPPTIVDFFKDTHCNSKTGYSEDLEKLLQDRLFCNMIKKLGCEKLELLFFYSRLKWRPSLLNHNKKGKLQD